MLDAIAFMVDDARVRVGESTGSQQVRGVSLSFTAPKSASLCSTLRVPIVLLVVWVLVGLKAAAQVRRKLQAVLLREQDGRGIMPRLTRGISQYV